MEFVVMFFFCFIRSCLFRQKYKLSENVYMKMINCYLWPGLESNDFNHFDLLISQKWRVYLPLLCRGHAFCFGRFVFFVVVFAFHFHSSRSVSIILLFETFFKSKLKCLQNVFFWYYMNHKRKHTRYKRERGSFD